MKDLVGDAGVGVGGKSTILKPTEKIDVEIEIGGFWFHLPSIHFGQGPVPLLGRDVMLKNFTLVMKLGETELRPKK